jgi:hemerythrin superfamily protein
VNAIDLLTRQHREVDQLFADIEKADEDQQIVLAESLAELLTVHTTIEERIFYPSVKNEQTMELLQDSVQEHLEAKRAAERLLELEPEEGQFMRIFKELKKGVEDHVGEEENDLFPLVRQFCDLERLEDLGRQMETLAAQVLEEKDPAGRIPFETDTPAPL